MTIKLNLSGCPSCCGQPLKIFVVFEQYGTGEENGRLVDDRCVLNGTTIVQLTAASLRIDVSTLWHTRSDNTITAMNDIHPLRYLGAFHIEWCKGGICCSSSIFDGVPTENDGEALGEFYRQVIPGPPPEGCFDAP